MNSHSLKVLEFDQIIEKLHGLCQSAPAKRYNIMPSTNFDEIKHWLDCLTEMEEIYQTEGGPPGLAFDDVGLLLESCAAEGTVLEPAGLMKVRDLYQIAGAYSTLDDKYANLKVLTAELQVRPELVEEIDRTVELPNEIKDSASPELRRIRRQIRSTREKLEARFNSYLESDDAKYLSDRVVTIRDGRYVLPVREGEKNRIKGITHDRSSTGATFFIEPLAAVELNNNYRELQALEKQEIYHILRRLTDAILHDGDGIKDNIRILLMLDIYSARARFARRLSCSRPALNRDKSLRLKQASHPLLLWRAKDTDGQVIPFDLELGNDFTTLMITGPNTGGKTVTLKTVGLLCLMVQSGMFIPAAEDSVVPVFRDIFADIGDEQSLEASLSTFSAHLANIQAALDNADEDCLVLLDEIGAGTDPDEGAALGQALIENLTERGILSIVTTHHGRLKALAVNLPGVHNASLDFDTVSMRPTFRFRMGIPGLSYAIETARKLGLPESITARAASLIDQSERKLAAIIAELTGKLQAADENLRHSQATKLSYEALARIYTEKLESLEKDKKRIMKTAIQDAEKLIQSNKSEIENLIEAAKKSDKKIEALRQAEHAVRDKIQNLREEVKKIEPAIERLAAFGEVGEKVYLPDMEAAGEIIEKPDTAGRVRVRIGSVILQTELRRLFKKRPDDQEIKSAIAFTPTSLPEPKMEIDLRGLTFEEAEPLLEKYLFDVYRAGLNSVSIIHGKGTGALRTKVQNYLKNNSHVKSFRLGHWNEGSYGVTVVEINRD